MEDKKRTSPVAASFFACKVATISKHFFMSGIFAWQKRDGRVTTTDTVRPREIFTTTQN